MQGNLRQHAIMNTGVATSLNSHFSSMRIYHEQIQYWSLRLALFFALWRVEIWKMVPLKINFTVEKSQKWEKKEGKGERRRGEELANRDFPL